MGTAGPRADLHQRWRDDLASARAADGSLGWTDGADPEPEPTALCELALGDGLGADWLERHQDDDGFVLQPTAGVRNTGAMGLVALALGEGAAADQALDAAIAARAQRLEGDEHRDDPRAWGWTPTTYSWVEPTSRVLLATRVLRPTATDVVDEALAMLRSRETPTGGWNYGNPSVLGTDLKPYLQTTAAACIALAGLDEAVLDRGLELLRTRWADELGGLTLSMTLAALRLAGETGTIVDDVVAALAAQRERSDFLGNRGTLAWAVLATAPEVPLAVAS